MLPRTRPVSGQLGQPRSVPSLRRPCRGDFFLQTTRTPVYETCLSGAQLAHPRHDGLQKAASCSLHCAHEATGTSLAGQLSVWTTARRRRRRAEEAGDGAERPRETQRDPERTSERIEAWGPCSPSVQACRRCTDAQAAIVVGGWQAGVGARRAPSLFINPPSPNASPLSLTHTHAHTRFGARSVLFCIRCFFPAVAISISLQSFPPHLLPPPT